MLMVGPWRVATVVHYHQKRKQTLVHLEESTGTQSRLFLPSTSHWVPVSPSEACPRPAMWEAGPQVMSLGLDWHWGSGQSSLCPLQSPLGLFSCVEGEADLWSTLLSVSAGCCGIFLGLRLALALTHPCAGQGSCLVLAPTDPQQDPGA